MLGNAVYDSNQSLLPGLHYQDVYFKQHIMEQVVLWRVREREEKVKQDVIIIYFYHFRMNEDQSKSVFKANNIFIFYSAGRDNSL
jgi:hypothetical protein